VRNNETVNTDPDIFMIFQLNDFYWGHIQFYGYHYEVAKISWVCYQNGYI